jgi:hypothetical protein
MTAMNCERFEEILVDYFEGDLPVESKAAADEHAKTCESCGRIVTDVNRITADAAALPAMQPGRDLWSGIEERISAPVIALGAPTPRRIRSSSSAWMAAAAAALIVTTAGITYLATSRHSTPPPARVATISAKPVTATAESSAVPTELVPSTVASASNERPATEGRATAPASTGRLASNERFGSRRVVNPATPGSIQADAIYAKEIDILERMVNASNSGLDPATVQIVKKNLQVIDDAIAQSKAALVKDPASPLLYDQMTRAMGKKIDLLRTMASLSSSTE